MRIPAIILFSLVTTSADLEASEGKPIGLEELRWKYRVILVFAQEPFASNARSNLEDFAAGVEERDIAWFVLGDDELHSNYRGNRSERLREQLVERFFTPKPTGTLVLLIGKDGTIKSRSEDLDLEATFDQIDQMPMRRAELQRQGDDPD